MKKTSTIAATWMIFGMLSYAGSVHADVSSWLSIGSGPGFLSQKGESFKTAASLRLDAGLGSSPSLPVVVGAVITSNTFFSHGTDLGVAIRVATSRYVQGDWGAAVDVGGYRRWWSERTWGPAASVHVGAPLGLQLSLGAALAPKKTRAFQAVVGVDLLRLTVHRTSLERYWKNPRPAYQPVKVSGK